MSNMSMLGKLTNSLVCATNENTLALANLNFDFALVKFEAPAEFLALGAALSTKRRHDAEEGPTHRTARRLGALFEHIVPPTPLLVRAYGLRTSEIVQTPGINPVGTTEDGPFQAFAGADGTTIWAAATSGKSQLGVYAPIAVHLLACILARSWEAKTATSIWVELVAERQRQLEENTTTHPLQPASHMAARQDISREQLAVWDASARAWLRSADEAKARDQKKLLLITKNIGLPVSTGHTTYERVIEAWRNSMSGFENLLRGMPQQISDGAILLALTSWHLYPDLIVLGPKTQNVRFSDTLVPPGGVATIGLRNQEGPELQAITWSLTLSHLRYYGDPVSVASDGGNSRVTMKQLHVVALSGLFRSWGLPVEKTTDGARWLRDFWRFLVRGASSTTKASICESYDWILALAIASESTLEAEANDKEELAMLINFGRRRARFFLGSDLTVQKPFFGLCNRFLRYALQEKSGIECLIRYLRAVAESMGFESGDALIHCTYTEGLITYHEYATAVAHTRISQKRHQDGTSKVEKVHARWLCCGYHFNDSIQQLAVCSCSGPCTSTCSCLGGQGLCTPECHSPTRKCQEISARCTARFQELESSGEECLFLSNIFVSHYDPQTTETSKLDKKDAGLWMSQWRMMWKNPPPLYHGHTDVLSEPQQCPSYAGGSCHCFESCFAYSRTIHDVHFAEVTSTPNGIGLYVRHKASTPYKIDKVLSDYNERVQDKENSDVGLFLGDTDFASFNLEKDAVLRYLRVLSEGNIFISRNSDRSFWNLLIDDSFIPEKQLRALKALLLATNVYRTLHGATIPLSMMSSSLDLALWIPQKLPNIQSSHFLRKHQKEETESVNDESDHDSNGQAKEHEEECLKENIDESSLSNLSQSHELLSRAQTVSCIAMFEAGILVDPAGLDSVMALAWENSIFVVGLLLSDPSDAAAGQQFRRIIGNVGRPGLSLMVPPQKPRIRPPSNDFRLVNHLEYDGKREDNFRGTSLHLEFTKWNMPLAPQVGDMRGVIDSDAYFLESVVSVRDEGKWVADLNVLKMLEEDDNGLTYDIFTSESQCSHMETMDSELDHKYTSIDTWDELLDLPETTGIFRARGNWVARLAAVSVLCQTEETSVTILRPDSSMCLQCIGVNAKYDSIYVD